jgi:hypothetical protein
LRCFAMAVSEFTRSEPELSSKQNLGPPNFCLSLTEQELRQQLEEPVWPPLRAS